MLVAWIAIAAVLLAVELHHLQFFALFGAIGAGAAAGVAASAPDAIGVQIAVFVLTAVAGVAFVRPQVTKVFARRQEGIVAHGVHGGLVGARGVTLDTVGAEGVGHIRLLGETWLAASQDGGPIEPGTAVVVTAVQGTTLTVKETT